MFEVPVSNGLGPHFHCLRFHYHLFDVPIEMAAPLKVTTYQGLCNKSQLLQACQFLSLFANIWHFLPTVGKIIQLLSTFGNFVNFWQLWQRLAMPPCHQFILSSCHPVILSFCHVAILSPCHIVILSSCHLVILSSCHLVILSSCQFASLWASQLVSFSACASWSLRACFFRN